MTTTLQTPIIPASKTVYTVAPVIHELPSPCFVADLALLRRNLEVFEDIQNRSGASVILALKAFSMFSTFPELSRVLKGTTASSINEARLGAEEFPGEVHGYAVAYKDDKIDEWCELTDHLTFNSLTQFEEYAHIAQAKGISCGLRINPEYSEVKIDLYNPCRVGSRFGVRAEDLEEADLEGLDGLHFHALCQQGSGELERTLAKVEQKFGDYLHKVKWLNMGGGHHITREDYDVDHLVELVLHIRKTYDVEVFLEPGEAIAYKSGFLIARILDILPGAAYDNVILDVSPTAHMPDVLEMPYRPDIYQSGTEGQKAHTYRLGSSSCLAGDEIGTYSFDHPLEEGERLIFADMAHYTMVKTTMFNGIDHPAIATIDSEKPGCDIQVVREFGYEDFKSRLS